MYLESINLRVENKEVKGISTIYHRFDKDENKMIYSVGLMIGKGSIELDEETLLRALAVIETEKKLRNLK